jgi:hypothetical protein
MIKKFLVVLVYFFFVSLAQEGTASPYSFYGIGDVRFKGTIENEINGRTYLLLPDSIHILIFKIQPLILG